MGLTLKWKLFLIIIISLFLPFTILGSQWYVQSNRTIENNAAYYSRMLVEQTNDYIDSYLSELDRIAVPFLLNASVQDFLHLQQGDYYGQFLLEKQIRKELYANLFTSRPDIYSFTLILNESQHFSNSDQLLDQNQRNLRYLEILNAAVPASGFTIEGYNRIGSTSVITAYKVFYDPLQPLNRGILVVDLSLSKFVEICNRLKFENLGQAYLMDKFGQYIVHPNRSLVGTLAADTPLASMQGLDGFAIVDDAQGPIMTTYKTSSLSGWTIIFEVPMKSLNADLLHVRTRAIVIFLIIAAVILLLLGGFTYRLISDLSRFQRLMKRAEIGDLNARAPDTRRDEIGILYRSFNKMVTEYRRLINVEHASQLKAKEMQVRQKESKLAVLQSQINPHFLYNTLGTIHSYAILADVPPISRMVTNLADIFRYSMDNESQAVSLWNEIRYIRIFLDIQHERYEQLHTEIQVGPEQLLQEIPCIRLMLQPLVENALIHGYQDYDLHPDYVGIFCLRSNEGYEIRVIDKGKGMKDEILQHFNHLFQTVSLRELVEDEEPVLAEGGIGLWNVHKRLRLLYGMPYGLWIEQSNAEGTVIRILVPNDSKGG
ncbi:Sensor histidine kinase YehU [compost metagenome]